MSGERTVGRSTLHYVAGVVALVLWGASALWLDPVYLSQRDSLRALWGQLPAALRFALHNAHWAFYLGFAAVALVGLARGRRALLREALVYVCAQLVISVLLARALKIAIGRPRPGFDSGWLPGALDSAHHSLPSGHATDVAVGLSRVVESGALPWIKVLALLPLLLTGADRLLEGVHHPSDVVAGLVLGSVGTSLISGRIKAMLGRSVPGLSNEEC